MRASGRAAVACGLAALGILAFWTRLQFIHLYGGCSPSYLTWAQTHYFGGLTEFYLNAASWILEGRGYTALVYTPGYPLFLAALARLGLTDVNQIRLAQAALDAATVPALYLLACRVGLARTWAMGAAAVYAVFPLWAAGSIFPLAESLSTLLVLWMLVLLGTLGTGRSWRPWVVGASIGIAALIRSDLLLWIIPSVVWVVWNDARASWRPAIAIAAAFAVVIGAWGLHNRRVHGVWLFGSTSSGPGFWEGLGELPNDYGYVLGDSLAAKHVREAKGYEWSSIEANDYFTAEYVRAWREHPAFVVRVIAARIPRILFESERLQPLFFGRLRQLVDGLGLACVVAAVWLRRRHVPAVFLLSVLPLYALGSIGLVHYEARYVRYVEISYVLGALVVLSESIRLLTIRRPQMASLISVLVLVAATGYALRELRSLRAAAGDCRDTSRVTVR